MTRGDDEHSGERGSGRGSERGSALLELPLIIGLMVLPFALLVLTMPVWIERRAAADAAASQAARAVVAGGFATDAAAMVDAVASGYGLTAGSLRLLPIPEPVAGSSITISVQVDLPVLELGPFGRLGERTWTSSHVERVPDHGVTR